MSLGWPSFTTRPLPWPAVERVCLVRADTRRGITYKYDADSLEARLDGSFYCIVTRGGDLTAF